MRVLRLCELESHDVYELAYAHSYPKQHWSSDSLYLSDDKYRIEPLAPYLSAVFRPFPFYGEQHVTLDQWQQVYHAYLHDSNRNPALEQFFVIVQQWLQAGNRNAAYFWILGI